MSNIIEKGKASNTVSVKLKPEIRDNLNILASFKNRTSHFLMNEAINHYVEAEIARMNFIKAGESAAKHYEETGLHITIDEFSEWAKSLAEDVNSPLVPCHK